MGGKGCIHCRTYNSKVVLFFEHEFFQSLHCRLFLASFRVYQSLRIIICSSCWPISIFRSIDWWICTTFLLSQAKVDKINEMRLIRIISNYNICWLQITMNIALRVNALQSIHELECNNDDSLNLELAFFEWFFKLFQIYTEKLHHQVIIVLVWAVRKQTWETDPTIFWDRTYWAGRTLLLLLLLLKFSIKLNSFRVLILNTVFF